MLYRTCLLLLAGSLALQAATERTRLGNLILEHVPEAPPMLKASLAPYLESRTAEFAGWSEGGRSILINTRFGEVSQVHRLERPGGARRQLTFYDEPVEGAQPRPQDGGFAFLADEGGNEQYQIYLFDTATAVRRNLSGMQGRSLAPSWSPDGTHIAYANTARTGIDYDIYIRDVADPSASPQLAFEGQGYFMPVAWSPSAQRILLFEYRSRTDSRLHILDVASGEATRIQPDAGPIAYGIAQQCWSPDGQSLYFTSDQGSDFQQLKRLHVATGTIENLTKDSEWDVESFALSPDGRQLAYSINEGGISRLYQMDTQSGTPTPILHNQIGPAVISDLTWHPKGQTLAMTISAAHTPRDVFTYDPTSQKLRRWTFSETGGLDPEKQFVQPHLIHYPTFDERHIPAFVYEPDFVEQPMPVVVYLHGGPASQFRPSYIRSFQAFMRLGGVAFIAPNVRGSSGYGKAYVNLDNGRRREDSVKDVGALLDWIETQPQFDSQRVIVMGGSYGGYMVYAALVHYGERLAGGIASVGISNFVTFLENTSAYRRDLRRVEYGDERDPQMRAFLQNISPLNNAEDINRPMLIAQGANDPRVPVTESEQIVQQIRNNGGNVWYLLAMDEGHGFAKKTNYNRYTLARLQFILHTISN